MGKFTRKLKRQFALDMVKEYKAQHKGQKFNPKTETWVDVQRPFIKANETLEEYQARNIKNKLSKIGGKD